MKELTFGLGHPVGCEAAEESLWHTPHLRPGNMTTAPPRQAQGCSRLGHPNLTEEYIFSKESVPALQITRKCLFLQGPTFCQEGEVVWAMDRHIFRAHVALKILH